VPEAAGAAPADDTVNENSMKLVGEVWTIQYGNEPGMYTDRGNQCIGWLAKLLARPNRSLTVAELRGDPEGQLKADAQMGSERETDEDGIRSIRARLQEIEEIAAETGGGSESLDAEKATLLRQVEAAVNEKKIGSKLKRGHHNMATQIRAFLREKLAKDMPKLATHLTAALKLEFPEFGYFPPGDTPTWKI
jgi:hypothetical protein